MVVKRARTAPAVVVFAACLDTKPVASSAVLISSKLKCDIGC
jgi:hypothetical protein